MNGSTSVGKRVQNLQIGPEFDAYTMVIIHAGQTTDAQGNTKDLDYIAGRSGGRTLEIDDPMGSQAKANALLAKLQASKWQYQPYVGDKALLDPAAELGDGITVSDTFSAVYRRKTRFSSLMAADIEAPSDEEIDHEYPYIPKQDRVFKRETQFTRSQLKINANEISAEVTRASAAEGKLSSRITINANAITAEVTRASTAEGTLSSRISQNATSISAEVSRATAAEGTKLNHTYDSSSFSWQLTSSGFYLKSNGRTEVFKCTKDGIEIKGNATVTGKIQATTGYIGSSQGNGFTITSTGLYNGKSALENGQNGIYIGKDGIALGAIDGVSAFKVKHTGAVTARNLTIAGGSIDMKDSNGNLAFKVTTGGDVTARNMTLRGQLKLQNADGGNTQYINADTLAQYASKGNSARNWIDEDVWNGSAYVHRDSYLSDGASNGYSANGWITADIGGGYTRGAYCEAGAGGGIAFTGATNPDIGAYPAWFGCQNLQVNPYGGGHLWVGDTMFTPQYVQDVGIVLLGQSM